MVAGATGKPSLGCETLLLEGAWSFHTLFIPWIVMINKENVHICYVILFLTMVAEQCFFVNIEAHTSLVQDPQLTFQKHFHREVLTIILPMVS